jgi:hypothetical protein
MPRGAALLLWKVYGDVETLTSQWRQEEERRGEERERRGTSHLAICVLVDL